jgi:outer membrane lipoprotein carrier protein
MLKKTFFSLFFICSTLAADILDFTTLKANFEQTIVNEQNNTIHYSGTLYILKPDKILWQYDTPIKKSIFITQHNVTIYEPELYQAVIFKQNEELNPVKMLNESKQVSATERISEFNGNKITIKLNDKKVESLSFIDKVGNRVTIRFVSYETNKKLDGRLFLFEPGDEIDIIRQ